MDDKLYILFDLLSINNDFFSVISAVNIKNIVYCVKHKNVLKH